MSSTATLLAMLKQRDIRLSLVADQLQYDAPDGAMSESLIEEVRKRKDELIEHLLTSGDQAPFHQSPLVCRASGATAPLSSDQRRLWFLDLLERGNSYAYNMPPVVLKLTGVLDAKALESAFSEVVRRHEVLRTSFDSDDTGPFQVVHPHYRVRIPIEDTVGDEYKTKVRDEASYPFSLASGEPLFRVRLFRVDVEEYVFCLTIHHIVCDGWSIGILVRELSKLYSAMVVGKVFVLPELPVQYGDFSIWQESQLKLPGFDAARRFWRDALKEAPTSLDLPTDLVRQGAPDFRGVTEYYLLSGSLTNRIKQYCTSHHLTEFMLLLTAFYLLLVRFTGNKDIVIGTPVSVRPDPLLEQLIGLFLNTVPIRIDISNEEPTSSITQIVKQAFVHAFEHRELPLEEIIREINIDRGIGQSTLFRTLFALQNAPLNEVQLEKLKISPLPTVNVNSVLDLVMSIEETDNEFEIKLRGASQLFERVTLKMLVQQYEQVVEELLGESTLVDSIGVKPSAFPASAAVGQQHFYIEESIFGRLRTVAGKAPDKVALISGDVRLSYGQLLSQVEHLSHRIAPYVAEPGTPIAIFASRTTDLVVSILAVLRTGGAYVPLDPDSPSDRIEFILKDSEATAVVIDGDAGVLPTIHQDIDQIDLANVSINACETVIKKAPPQPEDIAYIIYTSGSTGEPKGVRVSHSNVLRLIDSTSGLFDFNSKDVWTLFHSPAFDFSVWEIFGALLNGACLLVVPWAISRDPVRFYRFVSDNQVTVLNQTPSAFKLFENQDAKSTADLALRWIIFGGEALNFNSVSGWSKRHGLNSPKLVNMYGITETTVHTTYRRIVSDDLGSPRKSRIGKPLPDLGIVIVDQEMNPVSRGAIGEIVISGAGVAHGYHARPELSAEKFPLAAEFPSLVGLGISGRIYRSGDLGRWTATDDLEYCGRLDDQIKIHGYRLEPGEIEAVIKANPEVKDVLVMTFEDRQEINSLVAYLVWQRDAKGDLSQVKRLLLSKLPRYMCPSKFLVLKEFPLNINGKIDRGALPSPAGATGRVETGEELLPTELDHQRIVRQAWIDVIGIDAINSRDNFFELGGDSVRAALVVNILQEAFEEVLYVAGIFEHPVLQDYCEHLETEYEIAKQKPRKSAGVQSKDFDEFDKIARSVCSNVAVGPTKNPRAIFILSPPRSGSTLLRVLLGGHPGLFSPPELELLRFGTIKERANEFSGPLSFYLEGLVRALMELNRWSVEQATERVKQLEADGCSAQQMFQHLQEMAGGRILVDKTPSYSLDINALMRIEQMFERPLYIHLYRHPCGMIRSFVNAHLDQIFFRHDHSFEAPALGELIWNRSHQNILNTLHNIPSTRKISVNFEALTRQTRHELERVCEFLDLPFDQRMLDLYSDSSDRMTDGVRRESRMIGDVRFHQHKKIEENVGSAWQDEMRFEELSEETQHAWSDLRSREGEELPDSNEALDGCSQIIWHPSLSQERIWFLDQLDDSSRAYTIPGAMMLGGGLNETAFNNAVHRLTKRHVVLNSRFIKVEGEVRVDVSQSHQGVIWSDIFQVEHKEQEKIISRLVSENAKYQFDLSRGGLFRVEIVRVDERRFLLLVNLHHVVCDGWSLDILFSELGILYNAEVDGCPDGLSPLSVSFGDYANWQREQATNNRVKKQLTYWRKQLSGLPQALELPTDFLRKSVQTFNGDRVQVSLDTDVSKKIRKYCNDRGCTVFMYLLANFALLLGRITGSDDIPIGTPTSARPRKEFEGLVGFFANTLVLRLRLGQVSFDEILAAARQTCLEALSNQDISFEQLVSVVQPARNLGISPIFQVMFSLQRKSSTTLRFSTIKATPIETSIDSAKYDLSLLLEEHDSTIKGCFEFNRDLFTNQRIEFFSDQFVNLVKSNLCHESAISAPMNYYGAAEKAFLTRFGQGEVTTMPDPQLVGHWVDIGVKRSPGDAVAVRFQGESLTYAQFGLAVETAAFSLRKLGVGAGDRVGVCYRRDLYLVPWLLGILNIGACYVPLDPALPDERLGFILVDSDLTKVLCSEDYAGRSCFTDITTFYRDLNGAQDKASGSAATNVSEQSTAYICYTSGSTGTPKGVPVSHRSVVNLLTAMQKLLRLTPSDKWVAITTLSFDIHVPELLLPLGVGGQVCLASESEARDPRQLMNLLATHKATVLQATPSTWHSIEMAGWEGERGLRALSGGEALSRELATNLLSKVDSLWNMYGPTETTVWSSAEQVTKEELSVRNSVAIGRPLLNTTFYVVDKAQRALPVGAWGELAIGGQGLCNGYLNRPDLAVGRFVTLPDFDNQPRAYLTGDRVRLTESGVFEVSGRFDNQIKVRGVRVEPEEIEAVLEKHPEVRRAVVVLKELPQNEQILIGAIAVEPPQRKSVAQEVLRFSEKFLPATMVPGRLVCLEELPITPNGKVDRGRILPILDQNEADLISDPSIEANLATAGRDVIELKLLSLWREYLGVPNIRVDDNFFSVGGHSLLAVRLLAAVEKEFKQQLPLAALFEMPTVRLMAEKLRADGGMSELWSRPIELRTGSGQLTLFLVPGAGGNVLYFQELAKNCPAGVRVVALQPPGLDGVHPPVGTIEGLADLFLDQIQEQLHDEKDRVAVIGHSFGGLVAYEMACRAHTKPIEIDSLFIIDTAAPNLAESTGRDWSHEEWICHLSQIAGYMFDVDVKVFQQEVAGLNDFSQIEVFHHKLVDAGVIAAGVSAQFVSGLVNVYRSNLCAEPPEGRLPNEDMAPIVIRSLQEQPGHLSDETSQRNRLHFDLGWEEYLGYSVTVIDAPGDHLTMLQGSNAGELAKIICGKVFYN